MVSRDRWCSKMPCESCAVQFSVFKRKRACTECERYYCSGCLRRGGGAMCAPCRALSTRPLCRHSIAHLKVRDLQSFLQRQNVSTRGCVEKEELVNLCVSHVNSASYRRRGPRAGAGAFSTLKGFTNNINDFINSTFDIRVNAQPAPPPRTQSNCYNTTHVHSNPAGQEYRAHPPSAVPPTGPTQPPTERFTITPGGEQDIDVPVPEPTPERRASVEGIPVDTADCFEIEDLDDSGWEFINRPAEPLPNDSDVLLTVSQNVDATTDDDEDEERPEEREERLAEVGRVGLSAATSAPATPRRAASELELRRPDSAATDTDTASLQDEPITSRDTGNTEISPRDPITLDKLRDGSQLEALSVRQLKELLVRNRVEFRGCVERRDLLERARLLWRDHAKYKDDIESLPLEECCKICMAAPLECVLLECGHMAACVACARQLAECPICRQYVVRAVRFFRS